MTGAEVLRRVKAPVTDKAGRLAPLKAAALFLVVLPGAVLLIRMLSGDLGGNAYLAAIRDTGIWAIRLIVITLAVTPLRRLLAWPKLVTVRRMLGVAALVYSILHLVVYAADRAFEVATIAKEVMGLSLLVGTIALIAMIPLGATSTDAMVRRLGGNRWRTLHKLVYAVGVLAVAHYYLLLAKLSTMEATVEAGLFVLLMAYRALYAATGSRGLPLWSLAGLSIASGFAAMGIEAGYFGLRTNIDPWAVLSANFTLDAGLRPGWWVMVVGLGFVAAGVAREWQQRGKGRPPRPAVSAP